MMGRANKFLLSFTHKIFISREISMKLPQKYKNKTHIVGTVLDRKNN